MKEVVECAEGPCCGGKGGYNADHHGWDCPLSDPVGDVLRAIPAEENANPILEKFRKDLMAEWLSVD